MCFLENCIQKYQKARAIQGLCLKPTGISVGELYVTIFGS